MPSEPTRTRSPQNSLRSAATFETLSHEIYQSPMTMPKGRESSKETATFGRSLDSNKRFDPCNGVALRIILSVPKDAAPHRLRSVR
jgi:hypothetical protein